MGITPPGLAAAPGFVLYAPAAAALACATSMSSLRNTAHVRSLSLFSNKWVASSLSVTLFMTMPMRRLSGTFSPLLCSYCMTARSKDSILPSGSPEKSNWRSVRS